MDATRLRRGLDLGAAVKDRLTRHNGPLYAAAIAFFAFLALIPTLAAVIGVYGLVADPDHVTEQLTGALAGAPESTRAFLVDQMTEIADGSSSTLGLGVAFSLVLALFSASGAVANLVKALDVVYDLEETRKPWTLRGLAFGLVVGGVVVLGVVVFAMAALPALLDELEVSAGLRWLLMLGRFPLLAALLVGGLSVLYRIGPDHAGGPGRTRSPVVGATVGMVLFLVLSTLFGWYTANFGSYGETYGPLATIIVLLLWFQLSALAVIVGAEVDAELSAG